jgi:hypothetical protein
MKAKRGTQTWEGWARRSGISRNAIHAIMLMIIQVLSDFDNEFENSLSY